EAYGCHQSLARASGPSSMRYASPDNVVRPAANVAPRQSIDHLNRRDGGAYGTTIAPVTRPSLAIATLALLLDPRAPGSAAQPDPSDLVRQLGQFPAAISPVINSRT